MTLIPKIDEYSCLGHGDCEAVAPDAFRVDDVAHTTGSGTDAEILTAARSCPAAAIAVFDAETEEQIYP